MFGIFDVELYCQISICYLNPSLYFFFVVVKSSYVSISILQWGVQFDSSNDGFRYVETGEKCHSLFVVVKSRQFNMCFNRYLPSMDSDRNRGLKKKVNVLRLVTNWLQCSWNMFETIMPDLLTLPLSESITASFGKCNHKQGLV